MGADNELAPKLFMGEEKVVEIKWKVAFIC